MVKKHLPIVVLALLGAAWCYSLLLPWPVLLRWKRPGNTAFMEQRLEEARADGGDLELRREWLPLDRMSRHLRRAVIVAEDGNFYEHRGIDWSAVGEELRYSGDDDFSLLDPGDLRAAFGAFGYYIRNREKIRGRSTITQQLAKNLYFSDQRSLLRKMDELIVARRLERFLPKDRILELYLNVAEWGPGVFGAEAAARYYFDRSAANLTRDQAAALAATLPHPLTSNPNRRPGRMLARKNLILRYMGGGGPARTVPLEPEPPEVEAPEIELPRIELPDSAVPRVDSAAVDSVRPDTTGDTVPRPPPDSTRPPPDTTRSAISSGGKS